MTDSEKAFFSLREQFFLEYYMGEELSRKDVMFYETEAFQMLPREPFGRSAKVAILGVLAYTGCLDAQVQ